MPLTGLDKYETLVRVPDFGGPISQEDYISHFQEHFASQIVLRRLSADFNNVLSNGTSTKDVPLFLCIPSQGEHISCSTGLTFCSIGLASILHIIFLVTCAGDTGRNQATCYATRSMARDFIAHAPSLGRTRPWTISVDDPGYIRCHSLPVDHTRDSTIASSLFSDATNNIRRFYSGSQQPADCVSLCNGHPNCPAPHALLHYKAAALQTVHLQGAPPPRPDDQGGCGWGCHVPQHVPQVAHHHVACLHAQVSDSVPLLLDTEHPRRARHLASK